VLPEQDSAGSCLGKIVKDCD